MQREQARIVGEINAKYLHQTVEVLVEGQHKNKWMGRTRTNKLVFFGDPAAAQPENWRGRLAQVLITQTSPWSMQGRPVSDG